MRGVILQARALPGEPRVRRGIFRIIYRILKRIYADDLRQARVWSKLEHRVEAVETADVEHAGGIHAIKPDALECPVVGIGAQARDGINMFLAPRHRYDTPRLLSLPSRWRSRSGQAPYP